ncbi:MAG: hypothetical protein DRO67_03550 [Candidatus Asgardarchaeum californiense]|nr:MAG: hypothetical protein DRO67_03550 [Candidatus Asgardarchaeum californiense]
MAILAQLPPAKLVMSASATSSNANLVSGSTYLHGACLADFAVTCGNLPGVTMWAPVQAECDLGTLANNIDQTLFLDDVFVNSIEFSYTTGANATENYGAETDNKMWLLNDAAYVNYLDKDLDATDISNQYIDLASIGFDTASVIPTLSTGNIAFLRKDSDGNPAVTWYDTSANEMSNVKVEAGSAQAGDAYVYDASADRLYLPASGTLAPALGDTVQMIFAADRYSSPANDYFDMYAGQANSDVGALRQGQVEIYLVDPDSSATSFENAWRLTGCTISADLTREPLQELGHLSPYDRPLTLPVPITVTIDSTAGDSEHWARFAGLTFDSSLDDIDLSDLMAKDNMVLVVKVFEQTDEEAGGTGSNRKVLTNSVVGDTSFSDGTLNAAYVLNDREYALKTIIVKNLKMTDEGMTLDVGANATQTFGFRTNNDLFVVKGDVSYSLVSGIARNTA